MSKVEKVKTSRMDIKDPGIIIDPPDFPYFVDYEDEYKLNAQSAYNEHLFKTVDRCGCFHCGRIFDPALISDWLVEDDGSRSALCPFCSEDAIIVGIETAPLCTATLTSLYDKWYSEEAKKYSADNGFKKLPYYRGVVDYLKRGLAFYRGTASSNLKLGIVRLWPSDIKFTDNKVVEKKDMVKEFCCVAVQGAGGTVHVRAHFDEDGCYRCDIFSDDGKILPYEPWSGEEQKKILGLSQKYGNRLRGLINAPYSHEMILFIE